MFVNFRVGHVCNARPKLLLSELPAENHSDQAIIFERLVQNNQLPCCNALVR